MVMCKFVLLLNWHQRKTIKKKSRKSMKRIRKSMKKTRKSHKKKGGWKYSSSRKRGLRGGILII
jgi:hypothetical protein